jgi:hypothetical protein
VFDSINRCNIYLNNAITGNDFYTTDTETEFQISLDTFSVINPYGFHAYPIERYNFNIMLGMIEQLNNDVYVSPSGNNSNSGLTEDKPLQTIHHAYCKVLPDSIHANTIHLMEGTYSTSSNGEIFPVDIHNYINLKGKSANTVILDAEGLDRVIRIFKNNHVSISGITITGGNGLSYAGGIHCMESSPVLSDIILLNNISRSGYNPFGGDGGGLYCWASHLIFINSLILGNATPGWGDHAGKGGAVYCWNSNLLLMNVTLSENQSEKGAGIYLSDSSTVNICNTIMWNDTPNEIYFDDESVSNILTIIRSDIQGGIDGIVTNGNGVVEWSESNINEDPLFTLSLWDPYALSAYSPCIDAGTPDTTGLHLPPWDILDNQRIWDGDGDGLSIVDMGAYEYGSLAVGIESHKPQASSYELQVFPNPTSGISDIRYQFSVGSRQPAVSSHVEMAIYNIAGEKIRTLLIEEQAPGEHTFRFDASDFTAGIYFVRLQAGDAVVTQKVVVIR